MDNPTWMQMVAEFHEKFGHPIRLAPEMVSDREAELRYDLIEEELRELAAADADRDIIEVADALGDLIYVVCGAALVYGIDLDAVVREIHKSNLTKLFADGRPRYKQNGKVVKGPQYQPPDIESVLFGGSCACEEGHNQMCPNEDAA